MTWLQYTLIALAGAAVIAGLVVAGIVIVTWLLERLYPDAPDEITDEAYLETMCQRALRDHDRLGAFGAGVATGHPQQPTVD